VGEVHFQLVGWLAVASAVLVGSALALRSLLARHGSGRLAQLRFRRLHGAQVVERLGGRLDPRPGSPWIDTYVDERPVQLLAAPLDGAMQAGILLLDHAIGVNAWHTGGDEDELEAPASVDREALLALVARLAAEQVDSLTCGAPLDAEPRPPHLLRMRFSDVDDLAARLARVAPLLRDIEALDAP
jgi:hypothetical protein